MDIVFLVARILFVLIFISSGFAHFAQGKQMREYAAAVGAPAPGIGVPLSGLMILLGGLMVLLGIWGDLGALLLFIFVLPVALVMHAFWKQTDPQMAQTEQVMFLKNIGLAGGALAFFWLFVEYGDELPLTITGPLF